ncbi:MAG: DUF4238 domain-containing protein [Candidatus Margulisbacteria bacterium]|nr:DUF4238 domain-containing protein [Candidatus Margulisiibacteriota bacterium]
MSCGGGGRNHRNDRPDSAEFAISLVIKNYYLSHKDEQGKREEGLEKLFAQMEGSAKTVFDKWADDPANFLEDGDKEIISVFLSFMHCRVPRNIQSINEMHVASIEKLWEEKTKTQNDPEALQKEYAQFVKSKLTNKEISFEEFCETMGRSLDDFEIKFDDKYNLAQSLLLVETIYPYLLSMNWSLCIAPPNKFFITNDAPLNIYITH